MGDSILVVDDDSHVRHLLGSVLREQGFDVRAAASAEEAHVFLASTPVDLVLCDVQLPGQSGLDLVRELVSQRPDVAAIVLTGLRDPACVEEAMSLGVYGYFLKPIDNDELVINVSNALRRRALEVERRKYEELLEVELTRSQDALVENEDRIRRQLENIPGALYSRSTDDIWRCLSLTDRFLDVTGYEPSDFLGEGGRSLATIVHEGDRERVRDEIEEAIASGRLFSIAYRIVREDGSTGWIGERGRALYSTDGHPVTIDGTMSDISERKRLEAERDRMEAELRLAQKLEAIGQLAAGIAHEINTPIQFVGDSVAFLSDAHDAIVRLLKRYRSLLLHPEGRSIREEMAAADEEADLEYLHERMPIALARTFEGIERVASIVRAMKDFAHTSDVEKAPVDLNETIRTVLMVARNEYKYVADIETDLGDLPLVSCNAGEIGQVLLNLVVNAAHAIEDADAERGVIRIASAVDGPDVVLTISDTGCGIPRERIDRIFEPFFTTKEVGRGSGQGLPIARSAVDKHGGSLTCDSKVGKGTSFEVRLPIGDGQSASAGERAAA